MGKIEKSRVVRSSTRRPTGFTNLELWMLSETEPPTSEHIHSLDLFFSTLPPTNICRRCPAWSSGGYPNNYGGGLPWHALPACGSCSPIWVVTIGLSGRGCTSFCIDLGYQGMLVYQEGPLSSQRLEVEGFGRPRCGCDKEAKGWCYQDDKELIWKCN